MKISTLALFFALVALLSACAFAEDLPEGIVLAPTSSEGALQFSYDVSFSPAVPDNLLTKTGIQKTLEDFTVFTANNFMKDLQEKLGLVGLIRDDNGLFLRFELINNNTLRASSFYSSLEDSAGYKGYALFSAATTPNSLAILLKDIAPLKVGDISFPWTSVDAVSTYRLPISCFNGVQDDDESDIDVGGSSQCSRAWAGSACTQDSDCIEFSLCEDVPDSETGEKECSSMTAEAQTRSFEQNRSGANSSMIASTLVATVVAALAIMF